MSAPRRILVTGLGAVSALAASRDEHLSRLFAGESGLAPFSGPVHKSLDSRLEARVRGFDRRAAIDNRMLRKFLTGTAGYAVAAAGQALADAGLRGGDGALARCGAYVGSVCIDMDPEIFLPAMRESLGPDGALDIHRFATRGMLLIDPLFLVKSLPGGGLGGIAIEHQVLGPNVNLTNGAVSGLQAVAAAAAALQRGEADAALAGAYDSLLGMDSIAEHLLAARLVLAAPRPGEAIRPFDRGRAGYVLGEGAAFLLLETEEHARRRGARVYGELVAWHQATDPGLAGGEAGEAGGEAPGGPLGVGGLAHAAGRTLAKAGWEAGELDAIFGDGLAVEADDLREAAAARLLTGGSPPAFTAATPALGFTGAASAAFSLLHAMASLRRGAVPPRLNCTDPDPRCALPLPAGEPPRPPRRLLVWSCDRGVRCVAMAVGAASG